MIVISMYAKLRNDRLAQHRRTHGYLQSVAQAAQDMAAGGSGDGADLGTAPPLPSAPMGPSAILKEMSTNASLLPDGMAWREVTYTDEAEDAASGSFKRNPVDITSEESPKSPTRLFASPGSFSLADGESTFSVSPTRYGGGGQSPSVFPDGSPSHINQGTEGGRADFSPMASLKGLGGSPNHRQSRRAAAQAAMSGGKPGVSAASGGSQAGGTHGRPRARGDAKMMLRLMSQQAQVLQVVTQLGKDVSEVKSRIGAIEAGSSGPAQSSEEGAKGSGLLWA